MIKVIIILLLSIYVISEKLEKYNIEKEQV
jgi:hypothetical protein